MAGAAGTFKAAAAPPADVIAQIHFIGGDNISGNNANYPTFRDEFCSPQAHALQSQTLDKLSHAPGVWFKDKLPTSAGDGSAQLRPLLDDFLKSEWIFEMREAPGSPEYALAIHLDPSRAQLWQSNLRNLLQSWTKITARDIPGGWELKKDLPPNLFRFVRVGDWVVIGCGQNELPLADKWSKGGTIPKGGTDWLDANVNWPRLAELFPAFARFDFPAIKMQVTGKDGNMQLNGTFDLSRPLPPLEKWRMPVSLIHDPLTSFIAAQGLGPWLRNQSWARTLNLSPEPNQFFIWSLGMSPLQTFLAVPVPNSTNALAQVGQNLSADLDWQSPLLSPFKLVRTPYRVALQGTPFAAPEVFAMHQPEGDFLFADVFPNVPRGKAPPSQLMQALSQQGLVYYDWEVTSERLRDLPQLTQLALMLSRHRQLAANSAASQWLNLMGPTLGPSITQITEAGPQRLLFMRSAPAGLTAIELIALANWLEAPNFPGCDLRLTPRPLQLLHRPVKTLSTPAPVPAHH
ncbi:MAG TPA: hypothetical protein VMH87_17275 [Pseudomonadales bacterium]|nr:hypothetical protein [Pseudomonadales bacterium]